MNIGDTSDLGGGWKGEGELRGWRGRFKGEEGGGILALSF